GVCVRLPSATTSRLPPCLSLTVPTAKPVVDFHHQVFTHAGRTTKNSHRMKYPLTVQFDGSSFTV
ncbi:hypothetical protein, partial [Enterococcus faecium]|uniref:hypothetical protein n=1 Tax=Enterococcus faecium TaxID=1352 RepID=UPI001C9C3F62